MKKKAEKETVKKISREEWEPKTKLGMMVKNGEVTTLEQVFEMGKRILEPEIVDLLVPNMEMEILLLTTTQRSTDSGRRSRFRVAIVVGDGNGHVGVGVGKSDEIKPAIECAARDGKMNMISVKRGCGSWECRCGGFHSIPQKSIGKEGSTEIMLKPAPKGLGLAANDVIKKVLHAAGVKDVWSFSRGGKNAYNMAIATINALERLNTQKPPKGG